MNRKQEGFTLIELVVVLVLLGIIGAVATARFQNLSVQARDAALQGIAAEIASASAINYAAFVLNTGTHIALTNGGAAAPDCDQATLEDLLQGGWPDVAYTVAVGATACGGVPGTPFTCGIDHADATAPVTVTLICTGP